MEDPALLQGSIVLFTGMVAATLAPSVRRSIPRWIEVLLWVGLIVACVLGVLSITNLQAREMTTSIGWAIDQIIRTAAGLLRAGIIGWLGDNRFVIATWLVILVGADIVALALLRSRRQALAALPRVRLLEWMELPRRLPVMARPAEPDPLIGINRRLEAATFVAAAAVLTWLVHLSIWMRDVLLPREARRLARITGIGYAWSRVRLESVRETTSRLALAVAAWCAAAMAPVVKGLAMRIAEVRRPKVQALEADDRVADNHVVLRLRPARPTAVFDQDDDSEQTGRLAS